MLMFGFVGYQVYEWGRMQSWTPTQAKIIETKLEENPGSKGGSTYNVTAKYSYQVGNITYYSNNVHLGMGSDNIGSFHRDRYQELAEAKSSGAPVNCFFNPDNPEEAILYPELRWEILLFSLVFGTVFGGAGFLILFFSASSPKSAADSSSSQVAGAGHFQTSQFSSAQTVVKSQTSATVWVALGLSVFSLLFAIPACFLAYEEVVQNQEYGFLALMILPLLALVCFRWFLITLARHRRFKGTELHLRRAPVRVWERGWLDRSAFQQRSARWWWS